MALADSKARRPAAPAARPAGPATGDLAPMLRVDDLAAFLSCSRREVERMRASGRLPRPDLHVGKRSPRWMPATITGWIRDGGA